MGVAYKMGRATAVSATARKLSVIIWNMVSKQAAYPSPTEYLFHDQKRKIRVMNKIKKNIAKLELKPDDPGFAAT
jgi:transposase